MSGRSASEVWGSAAVVLAQEPWQGAVSCGVVSQVEGLAHSALSVQWKRSPCRSKRVCEAGGAGQRAEGQPDLVPGLAGGRG